VGVESGQSAAYTHHAPAGGHSSVYADRQDWTILDEDQPVGRIYEDTFASTSDDRRWFWAITRRRLTKRRPRISAQLDSRGKARV
jgi:hypothetical protein